MSVFPTGMRLKCHTWHLTAAAAVILCLGLAAASQAQTEAQAQEPSRHGNSWLWEWADPYRPETLHLSAGDALFLRRQGRLTPPRTTVERIVVDPETGAVREMLLDQGRVAGETIPMTLDQYRPYLTRRSWRDHWTAYSRKGLAREAGSGPLGGTFKLELPVEVPRTIQKIIGRGKPNLRVSGSENITVSGKSTWQVGRKASESGRQSKFPQLNLKQELAVNVSGEIGEKINVDIDQNSQESLANRIRINYRGYEDEIIQTLDLGNTNLSLPGSQFVSYNGRHQGLFGVKTSARLGDVDVTLIASKQEGQTESNRFIGNSTVRSSRISDVNYAARTFYFLGDPREVPFDIDVTTLEVWVDDRNAANNTSGEFAVREAKAYVYEKDYQVNEEDMFVATTSLHRVLSDSVRGDFQRLIPDKDYTIIYFFQECPTIWLTRALGEREVLAVSYFDRELGRQVGKTEGVTPPDSLELRLLKASSVDMPATDGTYNSDAPFYPTIRYEMRNIYNLGAEDILDEGFNIVIRPKSATVFDDDLNGIPYVELLGLDRLDQDGYSASQGGAGADGQIDVQGGAVWLNQGLLIFPDLRPFAPDEVDLHFWRHKFFPEGLPSDDPDMPYYPPLEGEDAIPEIYDKKNPIANQDTKYEMSVEFRSSLYGETIFLKGNILEGSETVIANGQRLERDRDYRIDYDTGSVTLISDVAKESAADLTIDYSFKPLFALGQRTLLGVSTSYKPVDDHSFATTWIYESKGATERRPKLGEEPSLTVIGDVAGSLRKTPLALTRFIDQLPLISTDSPSSINMSGEIGMSFPNPNTEGQAYVEDFEGTRDDFNVDLSRVRWFYSSLPVGVDSDTTYKAVMRWYNPRKERRVRADALQPELSSLEGDDTVEAIELDIVPRMGRSESWAGVTQSMSVSGTDFSRKQFLEIWVNDLFEDENGFRRFYGDPTINPDSAKIYIDIGAVSEDAYWNVNRVPRGEPDSEDSNHDQQLDDSDLLEEDTGLDTKMNAEESDEDQTGSGGEGDPHGDDYDLDPDKSDLDWTKFLKINGTEDNDRLDTEDINRDGYVNASRNSYFEYCVNLAESEYLDTVVENAAGIRTGWRRYRIPIKGGEVDVKGSPSLDSIEHVRIWITGFSHRSRIQIAKMAFTGNRWTVEGVFDSTGTEVTRQELEATGEEFLVGVVNNKEDKDIYAPPFDPGKDGNIPRREQSLLVTYRNLRPGHMGRAFRAFDPSLDFTLYRSLKFYVWGDHDDPSVRFLVRMGDDKRYYEVETPLKSGWQEILVDLVDLTHLKSDAPDSLVVGDRIYRVFGTPRFTQVRRISMGLVNRGEFSADGRVWFNDFRLAAVRRDIGIASRLNVQAALANFMNISGSYEGEDEDFLGIGRNRGTGIDRKRYSLGGKLNAHTLMAPLRITLPISFNFSQNTSVPKFKTGDDRELLAGEERDERTLNKSTALSADLGRSPSRNPFLKYSVDAMRANIQWRRNQNSSPVNANRTEVVTTRLRYDVSPPQKAVPLVPGVNVNLLPSNLSLSFGSTIETRSSFDKDAGRSLQDLTNKPASMQMDVGYRPLSSVTTNFGLTSNRDLRRKRPVDFLGGLNIGTEVNRKEKFRANFSPKVFWWLGNPSFNYGGSYDENHNPGLTTEEDRKNGETRRNVGNSRSFRSSMNVPWGRFMELLGGADADTGRAAALFWAKPVLGALSQFNNITLARTVTDRSTYTGIYGVPDLRYKLGLSRDLGRESRQAPSGAVRQSTGIKTEARTDGALHKDVRLSVAYLRDQGQSENTSGSIEDDAVSWPDTKVDISSLERWFNLENRLTRLSAQISYLGRKSENSTQGGKQKSVAESKQWRPLLSLNAVWKGGMSTTFTSNRSTEVRTTSNAGLGQSRTITSSSYSLNLQKTIRGGEGISLPFGRQTGSFQKTISITLNLLYSTNKSSRRLDSTAIAATARGEVVDADNDKFRVASRATYNFSSNMVGSFELSFDQNRNNKIGRTVRGVAVSASARLRF